MVHYEDVPSDETSEDEVEVSRLKTAERGVKKPAEKSFPSKPQCLSCGENHPRGSCHFRAAVCRQCGKPGHLARVCRSSKPSGLPVRYNWKRAFPIAANENCFTIFRGCRVTEVTTRSKSTDAKKLILTIKIEGVTCPMEVDTGSTKSIVPWATIKKILPALRKSQLYLSSHSHHRARLFFSGKRVLHRLPPSNCC